MSGRTHVIQRFVDIELGDRETARAPIAIVVDLSGLSDDQVMREVEERDLNIEVISDSPQAERAIEFQYRVTEELPRLAELAASGDMDAVLDLLRDLAPGDVPLPSTVKRIVADRQAEPARRFL
ncbi:hypothetical protein [Aureimonas sp. AU12]|uniref:hypothetical protein n=1 Tax=Aureimonas sp. AU12 TaxID=1638161 RepID=UPI000785D7B7|nr:hypothetical protein [Aureimonas sp. AU12]